VNHIAGERGANFLMSGDKIEISASEYYRKSSLIPLLSWRVSTAVAFGDHRLDFDLPGRRVVRTNDDGSEVVAVIHDGFKGRKLRHLFGTFESDTFVVTKRRQDWLSTLTGNVVFEITLKESGESFSVLAMRFNFYDAFKVGDIMELRLIRGFKYKVEGTCAEGYQDLAEMIASLLLYHSEDDGPSG
jgi:hypothetical protein